MSMPEYHSPTEAAPGDFQPRSDRQKTQLGFEIPVPSKSQIMRDFEKIATATHDDEDDD